MKKKILLVVFIFTMFGSCFAQNMNNERRIIGTWVEFGRNNTWTFNADGIVIKSDLEDLIYRYIITDNMLFIIHINEEGRRDGSDFYEYSISSDGRSLILKGFYSDRVFSHAFNKR